jgi:D-serine deaminase-like pyridoxal phosphate-dependent protein
MHCLEELPTPSVLVDLDVLGRNIARMQERARSAGVKLRPHVSLGSTPNVRAAMTVPGVHPGAPGG